MTADAGQGVGPEATEAVPLAHGEHPTREQWEKATAAVLRKTRRLGEDDPDSKVWDLLSKRTLDGIEVSALGTAELVADLPDPGLPGQSPFTRGAAAARELDGWDVRSWLCDPDVDRTRDHVVTDLENGVNSLWFSLGEGAVPADSLGRILEPVYIDLAAVVVEDPADPLGAARALDAVIDDKAVVPAPGTNYGADPIGNDLRGVGVTDLAVATEIAGLADARAARGIMVDATAAHDLGASEVTELAYSLFAGVTYLRLLTESGMSAQTAAEQIDFRYAATDEQFVTIAKLRAARRLWGRVLELSGAAGAQHQQAVTSRPMMTSFDPWVNMLRTTVAAFAAGVGGAESVTVLPFDEALGLPEAFSRRIARNTSALLINESHVGAVIDPAGGSYAVEKLTDDLARAAWEAFGRLDQSGSVSAALDAVREQIEQTSAERALQIADRRRPITGVSEFPNLHEELPERRAYGREVPVQRYAHEFEDMRRARAEQPVFLATMGPIAQHTARATFAANLFAAGGIDTVTAGATDDAAAVVSAYESAGKPAVVCLCGPDPMYAEWGQDAVQALRSAGAARVVLAGKPKDIDVDDSCAMGVDALAFLRRTREELGA